MLKVWTKSNTSEREGRLSVSVKCSDFLNVKLYKYNFALMKICLVIPNPRGNHLCIFWNHLYIFLASALCPICWDEKNGWIIELVAWDQKNDVWFILFLRSFEMLFQVMSCKCLRIRPVIDLKVLVYDLFFSSTDLDIFLRDTGKTGIWIDTGT